MCFILILGEAMPYLAMFGKLSPWLVSGKKRNVFFLDPYYTLQPSFM